MVETAQDAKQAVADTAQEVEDYLTANMTPTTTEEAALQAGEIPSNTADLEAIGRTSQNNLIV